MSANTLQDSLLYVVAKWQVNLALPDAIGLAEIETFVKSEMQSFIPKLFCTVDFSFLNVWGISHYIFKLV